MNSTGTMFFLVRGKVTSGASNTCPQHTAMVFCPQTAMTEACPFLFFGAVGPFM